MEDHTDEELVGFYISGDKKSLEVLISRYLKQIYNFSYGYVNNPQDAEDITQEAFVKAWKNIRKFDRSKKFKTWIFEIAKNTSIDYCRKKKVIPFSRFEDESGKNRIVDSLADESMDQDFFEDKDLKESIRSSVDKLPPKYREIVRLRLDKDYTFKEMADVLGEPLNTVKSIYRRAIIRLKKMYK
jgi:RNA polymerase sigma-70 factor (ECF subfamily)